MMLQEVKKCNKCGLIKPTNDYHKDKGAKSGLRTQCNTCINEQNKKWRQLNPEQNKLIRIRSSVKNQARIKDYNKKYHSVNPEKQNIRNKKYYSENREKVKIETKQWKLKNNEKLKNIARKKINELSNSYVKNNLSKRGIIITPETIELKREIIKLKRLAK